MAPSPLTVLGALKQVFPLPDDGGLPYFVWPQSDEVAEVDHYKLLPLLPFDVFAIVAHLLEVSGAYHHISPLLDGPERPGGASIRTDRSNTRRRVEVNPKTIEDCRELAGFWRKPM